MMIKYTGWYRLFGFHSPPALQTVSYRMVETRGWDDKLGGYSCWSSTLLVQSNLFPGCVLWGVELPFIVGVVADYSHIQRMVLVTEETTVTQHVSHRPIKCQSRLLWSQRGTNKVNGSHHGDNPLLRPTGIQTAPKRYTTLQAVAPINIKTVRQTSFSISRAASIDSDCCRLPTTSVLSNKADKLRFNQF